MLQDTSWCEGTPMQSQWVGQSVEPPLALDPSSCQALTLATTSVVKLNAASHGSSTGDHLLGLDLVRMAVTEEGR